MGRERLSLLFQHLHEAVQPGAGGLSDAELLDRFRAGRDPAAFEVLLWRHGPMVLRLCRRMLRHQHDAEDVFQATFLLLVRKSGSIRRRDALAGWLYRVAYRLALRLRATSRQRQRQEAPGLDPDALCRVDAPADDVRQVLDEEVNRLPRRYRQPFVLRYLAGLSNEDTARRLGTPEGTVCSRLARARAWLRSRLVRRGLAPGALALLCNTNEARATVPASLIRVTLRGVTGSAAAGAVPPRVAALTEGMVQLMFLRKVTAMAALLLFLAGGVGGLAAYAHWQRAVDEAPQQAEAGKESGGWKLEATYLDKNARKVKAVALSHNGKLLVVAQTDGTIRLWDVASGKDAGVLLKGHPDPVEAVAFSPDDKYVAGGCGFQAIVWNAQTGAVTNWVRTMYPGTNHLDAEKTHIVTALAFAPNSKMLACCTKAQNWLYRAPAAGKGNETLPSVYVDPVLSPRAVAYSADGQALVIVGYTDLLNGGREGVANAAVVDLSGAEPRVDALRDYPGGIDCAAFTPNGKTIAAGSPDGTVVLYDTRTATIAKKLAGHKGAVHVVAYSKDGKLLATAGADRTILLRDPAAEKPLAELKGHEHAVAALRFSPDGQTLTSADVHGVVKVWKLKKG